MDLLDRFLGKLIKNGELTLVDASGRTRVYGRADGSGRHVTLRLGDPRVIGDVLRHPKVGVGEAYMDGRLQLVEGDLLDLLDLVTSNTPWEAAGKKRKAIARGSRKLLSRLMSINARLRSIRNVAHHYDLSDRLYDLFLDSDRQYSCAYFRDPNDTLEEAQCAKKAHIAAKLLLKPGQTVLDIGCGWGGMALYLNRVAGVDVLGITLSKEQIEVARRRAAEEGVSGHVRFELTDYRDVAGPFDRIVSVGMFEHVGQAHYRQFFEKCRSLLAADGVMLLHTIGRMGAPEGPNKWTAKYIFPGYYVPSLSEIVRASEKTKMICSDVETLRLHYGLTLLHWYRRVQARREEIIELYDERFLRMWEFYLASSIVGFRHGGMVNYQIQYIRDRHALPIIRTYMDREEARLMATDLHRATADL